MASDDRPVLVIGATGFVGRRIVAALESRGEAVRCLARTPAKAADLVSARVSVIPGDMLDPVAVTAATEGVRAVVVCVHTISRQTLRGDGGDFMDVEAEGIRNVIAACRRVGVRRVIYVTSIGVDAAATSSWLRGRAGTEQALFSSGLDATVLRPGMVVGRGGDGFGIVTRAATKRFALALGRPGQRFRTVAVDDVAEDLVDLLDHPGAAGHAFDLGSDDVLTMREMTAVVARRLDRRPGATLVVPASLIRLLAPIVERVGRIPRGAIAGIAGEGADADMIGDPGPLRALLGRSDRPFADSLDGQVP